MNIDQISEEFYGQFGLAMHTVQVLERGLLELYALNKYVVDEITEKEYYKIIGNPKGWTLGKIKDIIVETKLLDQDFNEKLQVANKYRIFLAHNFWWERDIEFENDMKLQKLHKEIFQYISSFNELIYVIDLKINSIRNEYKLNIEEKMGLTDFKVRIEYIKSLNQNNKL